MTCDSPFIKDTLADQAWKAWNGCSDKPKEEPRRPCKHEPIRSNVTNFKKQCERLKKMTPEQILDECLPRGY